MTLWRRLLASEAPRATVLVRLVVAVIFASEGVQKLLFAEAQGAGRFAKIGIPAPEVMGPFVGVVELVCGLALAAGLLTRLAAVPLVIDMLVALASTKLPVLLGHDVWRFHHLQLLAPKAGGWAFLHEARTDLAMLGCAGFLVVVGGGAWSLDVWLLRRR